MGSKAVMAIPAAATTRRRAMAERRRGLSRSARLAVVCTVSALVFDGLFVGLVRLYHGFDVAYDSPAMHVGIDGFSALLGLTIAFLAIGRLRRGRRLADLLLAVAFSLLAVESLFLLAVPILLAHDHVTRFAAWTSTGTALLEAVLLAAAALTSAVIPWPIRRVAPIVVAIAAALVALDVAVVTVLGSRLPIPIDARLSPVGMFPLLVGNSAVLASQGALVALLALSAMGFVRKGAGSNDALAVWLGPGLIVAAFAAVNYVLFPSLYSDWVFSGDILRFAFYLLVLTGAGNEIRAYWREALATAVVQERQRMARDLHDGLAQELAFIATELERLGPQGHAPLDAIASAAERALYESRRAIEALTHPLDQPLDVAIKQTATDVARRAGARVVFELATGIEVPTQVREAILRVAREATLNAIRHAHASTVRISLNNTGWTELRIEDDGCGFDLAAPKASGFGLISMPERVEALGGNLTLRSEPGAGTTVQATLP